jgi:hypothetical protein
MFSPDGEWLAYTSYKSAGEGPEVNVRPFPGPGADIRVSTISGFSPLWSRDGRELFYRSVRDSPDPLDTWIFGMMVAEVTADGTFESRAPKLLFEGRFHTPMGRARDHDVTHEGRLLMVFEGESRPQPVTSINLSLNWFEELKRLVPTER